MAHLVSQIGGTYYRVADPEWGDPLDAAYAALGRGQRWNPPGMPCLYLNADETTARANVERLYVGLPYGPEDLDPEEAPLLVDINIASGDALDAWTIKGLQAVGLPSTYPLDASGGLVPHSACQPIGEEAARTGLDGVDARSAALGGVRELAWFPKGRTPTVSGRHRFEDWY